MSAGQHFWRDLKQRNPHKWSARMEEAKKIRRPRKSPKGK
jgi:hypothetical protein